MTKLFDITGKAISGEWGSDDESNTGIPIIRTTNFTNEGNIDYSNVITRNIKKKNIGQKFLKQGDIIIEKSGGSDDQPVGRVVYFNGPNDRYLFNNFTGLLRIKDTTKWYPRYVFWVLYASYKQGKTKLYQNRTTGLHNLRTDAYVKDLDINFIPLEEQKHISEVLDKVRLQIELKGKEISKLDTLIKARFVEMFGDLKFDTPVSKYIGSLTAGKSLAGKEKCTNKVLNTGAVSYDKFKNDYKYLPSNYVPDENNKVRTGNVLISRMNTQELVGATAYVWEAPENTYLPDRLWRANLKENVNSIFLWQVLIHSLLKLQIQRVSSGTSGSMKNISKSNFLKLKVPDVNEESQNKFASFVQQVDKSKVVNNLIMKYIISIDFICSLI